MPPAQQQQTGKSQKDKDLENAQKAIEAASKQALEQANTQFGAAVEQAKEVAAEANEQIKEQAEAAVEYAEEVGSEIEEQIEDSAQAAKDALDKK